MLKIAFAAAVLFSSSAVAEETIFDKVAGRWSWVGNEEACTRQFTNISFYQNDTRALFDYSDGTLDDKGNPVKDSHYTVLSYDGASLLLAMDGEERTTENGNLVQWTLVLVDQDTWIWRMSHWPAEITNDGQWIWPYRRLRCAAEQGQ